MKNCEGLYQATLNSALAQTEWKGPTLTLQNWRRIVLKKVSGINWVHVKDDVHPFLERENDIALVTEENCVKLLIPS